jgi:thiamine-phosphate pyrophosphorylase
MKPLSECRLYAFVDTTCLRGRVPEIVAQQLCDGGADIIQLRGKQSSVDEIRRMARAIIVVTRAAGVGLVINDFPAIAREVGADYFHLGQEDFFGAQGSETGSDRRGCGTLPQLPGEDARAKPGIGLSTHSPEDAARALDAGADYLGVGPVYPTGTKPEARPVTLEYVRWAAKNVKIPWFAIGGINLGNLDEVLKAGARRICVVSAILNAKDVAGACREFKQRLG